MAHSKNLRKWADKCAAVVVLAAVGIGLAITPPGSPSYPGGPLTGTMIGAFLGIFIMLEVRRLAKDETNDSDGGASNG